MFCQSKKLIKEFLKKMVQTNVIHDNPFKSSAITQNIYSLNNVDVIQLEINKKFRNINNVENLEKVVNSLAKFIEQYYEYINR